MSKNEGEPSAERAEQKPREDADTVAVMDPAAQLAVAAAERDQLAKEKAELQDKLLRRMAEFENFRKRADREKSELRDLVTMDTVRHVLPVLDDFERALASETSDMEYAKGMALIYQRLSAELQKLGLEAITAVGKKFDPHIHHALEMQPAADAEEHAVLAEFQKGYNFRGKLLRPALVRVAVAPTREKQTEK